MPHEAAHPRTLVRPHRLAVARPSRSMFVAALVAILIAALVSSMRRSGEKAGRPRQRQLLPTRLYPRPRHSRADARIRRPSRPPRQTQCSSERAISRPAPSRMTELTAALMDTVISDAPGEVVVFTAGDNVYQTGTTEEYDAVLSPNLGTPQGQDAACPRESRLRDRQRRRLLRVLRRKRRRSRPGLLQLRPGRLAHRRA